MQGRGGGPQAEEFPVHGQQARMRRPARLFPVDFRGRKRRRNAWIRRFAAPAESGEFALPAPAHGLRQLYVVVADEIEEGIGLAPLLTHEQQGRTRGKKQQAGGQTRGFGGNQAGQTIAMGPVTGLVVVLEEGHEAAGRQVSGRQPPAPAEKGRVPAAIGKPLVDGRQQILPAAEVGVIAAPLPGEQGMDGMVEVVVPHPFHALAAGLGDP